MNDEALVRIVSATLPLLNEGAVALVALRSAQTAVGIQARLVRHLADGYAVLSAGLLGALDETRLAEVQTALATATDEAHAIIGQPAEPPTKGDAVQGLPHGTQPSDPMLTLYLREIAPLVRYAARVAAALQSRGQRAAASTILQRTANLATSVRRIFAERPFDETQRAGVLAEMRRLQALIDGIVAINRKPPKEDPAP